MSYQQNGDPIRERDLYTRNRCVMANKTLREVKKLQSTESSFGGNKCLCKMKGPKPRKIRL